VAQWLRWWFSSSLDRAHQQRGPIKNPTAITVWRSLVQMPLRFFGHICRADPNQDHSRALYTSTTGLPKHCRRRPGRPRQTWLRTIENDLRLPYSIWVWRQLNGVLRTEQLGRHLLKRLRRWQAPDDDDDDDVQFLLSLVVSHWWSQEGHPARTAPMY